MKLSEFTRRARASRLESKAKNEAAFQRAIRDLKLIAPANAAPRAPATVNYIRSESGRPVITLFPR